MDIQFDRRTEEGIRSSSRPAEVWSDWREQDECWLFIAPHDDDIVCGAGLTFLAAVQCGIKVHAAVISNGRMGYCSAAERSTVARVRCHETRESFEFLGLPRERLHQFDYDDGSFVLESGRRFASDPKDSRAIEGGVGLQNSLTWLLREVRPTRVFMANRLDLHPDHRVVNSETVISIFHAQGQIWPELGTPITAIPKMYEYATYSDFAAPPTMRIRVSDDLVEKRLRAIAMYKSQLQIELIVAELRKAGGTEYLLEMAFDIFKPGKYDSIFQR